MAGKRGRVTPAIEAYVLERRRACLSHRAICAELEAMGTPLSLGAVHKIAPATAPRATQTPVLGHDGARVGTAVEYAPAGDGGAAAAVLPDDADLATLERYQAKYEAMAAEAEKVSNLQAFIALQRLLRDVLDRKRKWQPPPVERPEDNPDFVRAGELVAERLHKLVDDALRAAREGKAA